MADDSPLDLAQTARRAAPDDAGAEGAFYRLLADATLFLLLEAEAEGAVLTPRVFDLADGPLLLAFDSEERLASLGDTPLAYAALPGRVIAAQMAGQGLDLGLNLGTGAASEMLLPGAALDWMLERLAAGPQEVAAVPERFFAPGVPETLARALRDNLAAQPGLAQPGLAQPGLVQAALLAGVCYQGGRRGHLLAVIGAAAQAEAALARAVAEALAFSGLDAGEIDVLFLAADAPLLAALAPQALHLDLTPPAAAPAFAPLPPGMDRNRPPKLR